MRNWLTTVSHHRWLEHHTYELLDFARRAADPRGGARWLAADGTPDTSRATYTWITSRMVHVYGIGSLIAIPGAAKIAEAALAGLTGRLYDAVHGGWYTSLEDDGVIEPIKSCYDHAFVLLASTTAVEARLTDADELFDRARNIFLERFWDDAAGLCVDTWDVAFTSLDDYRGMNANMHAVEAMLSAASITGDASWTDRAIRICRFVAAIAEAHNWRIPEHYGPGWEALLGMNSDCPAHPFKPFGATVGHGLEWARLFLHTEAASATADNRWLAEAAVQLFGRAVADGWNADGHLGFVYTTDWAGSPVVRDRMHWVVAEAISAAAALYHRTGDASYASWYQTWWDYADQYLIDHRYGSWIHQLDTENQITETVWSGKPDTYHTIQATLVPRLPLFPMNATAIGEGHLE